jgi:hypothetical protein
MFFVLPSTSGCLAVNVTLYLLLDTVVAAVVIGVAAADVVVARALTERAQYVIC